MASVIISTRCRSKSSWWWYITSFVGHKRLSFGPLFELQMIVYFCFPFNYTATQLGTKNKNELWFALFLLITLFLRPLNIYAQITCRKKGRVSQRIYSISLTNCIYFMCWISNLINFTPKEYTQNQYLRSTKANKNQTANFRKLNKNKIYTQSHLWQRLIKLE